MWNQLTAFASVVAGNASSVLIAFAAIGTLTMAIVQTLKDLTPVRRWFNQWSVRRWIKSTEAFRDLVSLATAGHDNAFFDLEIERVCGLVVSAGGIVVDYPTRHEPLLWLIAERAAPEDIRLLLHERADGRHGIDRLRSESKEKLDAVLDAKARVSHQIHRNIDAFLINTAFNWKMTLQYASFALSVGIALAAVNATGGSLLSGIPIGLAAGFFAPIARDLIAVLSKAKA